MENHLFPDNSLLTLDISINSKFTFMAPRSKSLEPQPFEYNPKLRHPGLEKKHEYKNLSVPSRPKGVYLQELNDILLKRHIIETGKCVQSDYETSERIQQRSEQIRSSKCVLKMCTYNNEPLGRSSSLRVNRHAKNQYENKNNISKPLIHESEQSIIADSLLSALNDVKVAEKQLNKIHNESRRITLSDLIAERESKKAMVSTATTTSTSPPPPIPPKPQKRLYVDQRRATVESLASFMTKVSKDDEPLLSQKLSDIEAIMKESKQKKEIVNRYEPWVMSSKTNAVTQLPPLENNEFKRNHKSLHRRERLVSKFSNEKQKPLSEKHQPIARPTLVVSASFESTLPKKIAQLPWKQDSLVDKSEENEEEDSSNADDDDDEDLSAELPQPDEITARPESTRCSPSADMSLNAEYTTPLRVSLVAAPRIQQNILDYLQQSKLPKESDEYYSDISSRASTVFSYPWDLPPPLLGPSVATASTTASLSHYETPNSSLSLNSQLPFEQIKWATLHKHLSEQSPNATTASCSSASTLNDEERPEIPGPICVNESADNESQSGGQLCNNSRFNPAITNNLQSAVFEEETYDIIGGEESDLPLIESIGIAITSPKKASSANLEDPASPLAPPPPPHLLEYIYAQVKPVAERKQSVDLIPAIPTYPSTEMLSDDFIEIAVQPSTMRKSDGGNMQWLLPQLPPFAAATMEEGVDRGKFWWKDFSATPASQKRHAFPETFRGRLRHLEGFVQRLVEDGNSSFSKHIEIFIECTLQQKGRNPKATMQFTYQFMNGVSNFLQHNPVLPIETAINMEQKELKSDEFIDMGRELDYLVQRLILKPLHAKLIDEITKNLPSHSTNPGCSLLDRIKREINDTDLDQLKTQLLEPIKTLFSNIQEAYRPEEKLGYLIRLFRLIDENIQILPTVEFGAETSSFEAARLRSYALAFGLAGFFCSSSQMNGNCSDSFSLIEVHRQYIEGLISRPYLQSNGEGCRRLNDLVCLLRYAGQGDTTWPPLKEMLEMLTVSGIKSSEIQTIDSHEEEETTPLKENTNRLCLSQSAEIRDSMMESRTSQLTHVTSDVSCSPNACFQWERVEGIEAGCVDRNKRNDDENVEFINVLAADESNNKFNLHQVPLRSSLTVRELCNLVSHRMSLFDPKDYALFLYSKDGDVLMKDCVHLEKFLTNLPQMSPQDTTMTASIHSIITNERTPKKTLKRTPFRKRSAPDVLESLESHAVVKIPSTMLTSARLHTSGSSPTVFIYRRNSANFLHADDLIDYFFGSQF